MIFDPFYGASEQMILGALLGCGADEWRIKAAVEGLCGAPMLISSDSGPGINMKLAVVSEEEARVKEEYVSRETAMSRLNIMHEKEPVRANVMDIVNMIMDARDRVYGPGTRISMVSMGMIAGICTAIDSLENPYVHTTPVSLGGGMVETRCGNMPVPMPETMEVIKESRLITQGGPFDGELLTVEAAAILAYYTRQSSRYYPENKTLTVGYGKGYLDLPVPQYMRVSLAEVEEALIGDRIELLETNVDDVTGEVLGNLIEELLAMGARDVSIIPATMKKGRSGQLIRVVVKAEDSPAVSRRIMLETGTLGVRVIPVKHRYIASREVKDIKVSLDDHQYYMKFKVASDTAGNILDISVEYEDAKKIAKELGMPLKTVMRKADTEAWKILGQK